MKGGGVRVKGGWEKLGIDGVKTVEAPAGLDEQWAPGWLSVSVVFPGWLAARS